jgi:hypothetical protein
MSSRNALPLAILLIVASSACNLGPGDDVSPPETTMATTSTTIADGDPTDTVPTDTMPPTTETVPTTTETVPTTETTVATPTTVTPTTVAPDTAVWTPAPGTTWQWQLSGSIDTSPDVEVFDIDHEVSAGVVDALHVEGRKVICYLSAGTAEDYRDDYDDFPAAVLGDTMDDWPHERWLDVRALDALEPIMAARMDICADKGFDAVEPDNVDGYSNDTGFPLSAADQLAYNRMIADLAHERGLAVGLKNDLDQVDDLVRRHR